MIVNGGKQYYTQHNMQTVGVTDKTSDIILTDHGKRINVSFLVLEIDPRIIKTHLFNSWVV